MSLNQQLSDWETTKKPKSSVPTLPQSSLQLRERGNEFFRVKNFSEAKRLYTESLQVEETVESLINRAFACIKLGELKEAIVDCTRALKHDQRCVKAFARRAASKSGLGDHAGALEDYQHALRLEPTNKFLKEECEREETALQVIVASSRPRQPSPPSQQHPPNITAKRVPSLVAATQRDDSVLRAALAKLDATKSIPSSCPSNSFAFTNMWRDLTTRELKLAFLVQSLPEPNFRLCFLNSVEPDLFQEMISILGEEDKDEESLYNLLSVFSSLPSFPLAKMFLSKQTRDEILNKKNKTSKFYNKIQSLLE
jgi:tetratricopeptide (TPR) repeat protein